MKDQTLLTLVMIGFIVWMSIGVGSLVRGALTEWRAYKAREQILNNVVPVDYQLVIDEQKRVNRVYADGSLAEQMDEDVSVRESALTRIRYNVASIRDAGFVIGRQATTIDRGLAANPFKKGTGESKQWVRGLCMGRNIIDPKPYMDKA